MSVSLYICVCIYLCISLSDMKCMLCAFVCVLSGWVSGCLGSKLRENVRLCICVLFHVYVCIFILVCSRVAVCVCDCLYFCTRMI